MVEGRDQGGSKPVSILTVNHWEGLEAAWPSADFCSRERSTAALADWG